MAESSTTRMFSSLSSALALLLSMATSLRLTSKFTTAPRLRQIPVFARGVVNPHAASVHIQRYVAHRIAPHPLALHHHSVLPQNALRREVVLLANFKGDSITHDVGPSGHPHN